MIFEIEDKELEQSFSEISFLDKQIKCLKESNPNNIPDIVLSSLKQTLNDKRQSFSKLLETNIIKSKKENNI
jgi:hypothetical protein